MTSLGNIELEAILFRLHHRVSRWASGFFDAPARKFIELVLLVLVLLSFATFFYLHAYYIGFAENECLTHRISNSVKSAGGVDEIHLLRVRVLTGPVKEADRFRRLLFSEAQQFYNMSGNAFLDAEGVTWMEGSCTQSEPTESSTRMVNPPIAPNKDVLCSDVTKRSAKRSILRALARYLLTKADRSNIPESDSIFQETLQEVISGLRLLLAESETITADSSGASESRAVLGAAKNLVNSVFSTDGFTAHYIPDSFTKSYVDAKESVESLLRMVENIFRSSEPASPSNKPASVTAVSSKLITLYTSILQTLVLRNSEWEMATKGSSRGNSGNAGGKGAMLGGLQSTASAVWRIQQTVERAMQHISADPVLHVMMTSLLGVETSSEHGNGEVLHPLTSVPAAFKPSSEPSFLFALDKGMMLLSPEKKDQLRVHLVQVEVDANERCIGKPLSRWLLRNVVGYDTAVVNAIILALGGRGFVLAEHSGEVLSLGHARDVHSFSDDYASLLLFKIGTFCSAVFLLFASSSLVSFILAQTQQRMLRFTVSLQHHVRARLPLLPLVASHLVDSLIFVPIMLGVLFFLFEFFSDQLLAFLVLLVVWLCELWSITSIRTVHTLRVFPRIFGIFLTWFHVYYLAYPFGFQYMALGSSALAILCTIFHLWNRYELPALLENRLTARMPRMPEVAVVMNTLHTGATAPEGGVAGGEPAQLGWPTLPSPARHPVASPDLPPSTPSPSLSNASPPRSPAMLGSMPASVGGLPSDMINPLSETPTPVRRHADLAAVSSLTPPASPCPSTGTPVGERGGGGPPGAEAEGETNVNASSSGAGAYPRRRFIRGDF